MNGRRDGLDIHRDRDGNITIRPPAAVAAAQARPPNGQPLVAQPVAQIVINVPLSKVHDFMKLVEEWMSDESWNKKMPGL